MIWKRIDVLFLVVNECDPEQLVCHCCYELFPRNLCVRCIPCRESMQLGNFHSHQNIYTRISSIYVCVLPLLC